MSLLAELADFPQQLCDLGGGAVVSYRAANPAAKGVPVVLLHGIGSNSGSWLAQLQDGLRGRRLLAWNAPGYEASTAFEADAPTAQAYAQCLWAWLDALNITKAHLIGHSLGCIIVARAAVVAPHRVASLSLLSPAQGYGTADADTRTSKRNARLKLINTLGAAGMAQARGAALLSSSATNDLKDYAIAMMARVNVRGYTQATELLANADIASDLATWCALPAHLAHASFSNIAIACGELDTITPAAQCAALASNHGIAFTSVANAGHLVALEASAAVNSWLVKQLSNHE